MIPFMDLKRQADRLTAEILPRITEVISKTAFSGGPFVEAFEKEFATYLGVPYVAGVSNGTDALHLAFRALDIGPGDEVLVPTNSFIASAWGPSHAGATPVFVDCDPLTWNISLDDAERRLSPRTRAILPVHLYGSPCNMDAVLAFAARHKLRVVEDCAQAHGATWKGKTVGSFGDLSCFSFYPGKNLGAFGEAGAVATRDPDLLKRVYALRNHGGLNKYEHDELGFNFRMDGIQGAVLSAKLKHLPQWTARRRQIAERYTDGFKSSAVQIQVLPQGAQSVFHLFVILADNRERFQNHMSERGVQTGIHYPTPIHRQKAYLKSGTSTKSLPHAEDQCARCISLPMFPELTDSEIDQVIDAVRSYGK